MQHSLLFEILRMMGQSASHSQLQGAGSLLGQLIWHLFPSRREMAVRATGLHLGLPPAQARSVAQASFAHSGKSFLDVLLCRQVDHRFVQKHIDFHSPQQFNSVTNLNRPIVAVTAHLGAWEILAGILGLYFNNRQAQIIARQPKSRKLSYTLHQMRGHYGIELVPSEQASFQVLRCLKNQGISAFLVDHNCGRSKAVFLPFLQKFAAVNMGPAMLAIRSRAVVWPVFLLRAPNSKYVLHSFEPLDTQLLQGNFSSKVQQVASFYTRTVQDMLLQDPQQWFWMHNRWKTRPPWEYKKKRKRKRKKPGVKS